MARYVKDIVLNKPADFVVFMMNDYLQKNAFQMSDWKSKPVYRTGDAIVEGYKYLEWSYNNGILHVEAWLKGSFGGEWDLKGFLACMQKKPYRESLEQLFVMMQQDIPVGQTVVRPNGTQFIPVQTVDNTKPATMALIAGILSIVLSCISPLFGLLIGGLGFSRARMGSGSSKANLASIGKILSIIGMIMAVVVWILNILQVFAFIF